MHCCYAQYAIWNEIELTECFLRLVNLLLEENQCFSQIAWHVGKSKFATMFFEQFIHIQCSTSMRKMVSTIYTYTYYTHRYIIPHRNKIKSPPTQATLFRITFPFVAIFFGAKLFVPLRSSKATQ